MGVAVTSEDATALAGLAARAQACADDLREMYSIPGGAADRPLSVLATDRGALASWAGRALSLLDELVGSYPWWCGCDRPQRVAPALMCVTCDRPVRPAARLLDPQLFSVGPAGDAARAALLGTTGRWCVQCDGGISAERGFLELARQPGGAGAGQFYTLCSDQCLAAFMQGVEKPSVLDPESARVLREAATRGVAAEAVMQAVSTAMAVMLWADFDDWRAFSDREGWTSGPRTETEFRKHGQVLALVTESLIR